MNGGDAAGVLGHAEITGSALSVYGFTLVEIFGEPRTSEPVNPEPLNAYNKKGTFISESAFFGEEVSIFR